MNRRYIPTIIIFFLVVFSLSSFGQKKQPIKYVVIESTVLDQNGKGVPNALISGKEGATEVLTDNEGKFSIKVPVNTSISVEAKGYDRIILTTPLSSPTITLQMAPFLMDEKSRVDVPFGSIKKREKVGAMTVINPSDFLKYDKTQNLSLSEALLGRVPGLVGTTNIRGLGNAVIIIDGLPRDPSSINLEEIEQITVLKDANSAILYGVQANNGVILVTTKRGKAHKRQINFSLEQGMSRPVILPTYLNSADYMRLYNEALVNDGLPKLYTDNQIQNYASGKNPYEYPSVDYYSSEYLKDIKPFTKVLSELSGGNDITQYYANLGWMHEGSLMKLGQGANASSDRLNMRANINIKITNLIKSTIDAAVIFDIDKSPRGNFWNDAATLQPQYFSPLLPVFLIKHDANMSGGANLETAKRVNGDFILGGTSQYTNNPYGNFFLSGYSQPIQRTIAFNQGIEADLKNIMEGLKLKTNISFDISNQFNQSVANLYAVYQPTWEQNEGGQDSISGLTKIQKDQASGVQNISGATFVRRFGGYGMLDYARTFNDAHSLSWRALVYADDIRRSGIIIDEKHAHLGMQLGYNYRLKYFADFSSAYVNSPKLAPGNKTGFSPSVGLAWVMSNEKFMSSTAFVNYLKIRASAGIINTDTQILGRGSNYYLYESTITQDYPAFSWNDGVRSLRQANIARAANPDLTFEKVQNLNLGLEAYLFNRSIYVDANLFTSTNSGLIIQKSTLPALLGSYIPYENYNQNSYKGSELGINWSKDLRDFSFNLGANILYVTSNVDKRDEVWKNDYQYRKNRPVDAIYGLEAIGFFQDLTDIANSPSQKFGEVRPGDIKYKDQNNDGIIDTNDALQIGNSQPTISYGIHLNLRIKSLNFFALGNGIAGSEAFYNNDYFWVQGNLKYSQEVLNRWTPETASTATYPRLSSKNNSNNFRNSTFWMYKNDYFILNRAQLTYEMPVVARKLNMKELNVFVRGDNLARFSKDADKRQLTIGAEPQYRSYALGAQINF